MRRTTRRLVAALATSLLVTLAAAPGVAAATDTEGATILATEVGEEAPGPEPKGPNEEGNFGAPTDHEGPPFARFVAAVLTIAAVGGLIALGYLYVLLVRRPRGRQSSRA